MMRKTVMVLVMLIVLSPLVLLAGCEKQEYMLAFISDGSISDSDAAALCYDGMKRYAADNGVTLMNYSGNSIEAVNAAVENGAREIVMFDVGYEADASRAVAANPLVDFYCIDFSDEFTVCANTCCIDIDDSSLGFLAGYAAVMNGSKLLGVQGDGKDNAYACGFVAGAETAAKEKKLKKSSITVWYDISGSDILMPRIASWRDAGCQVLYCSDELAKSAELMISDSDCTLISRCVGIDEITDAVTYKAYDKAIYDALTKTKNDGMFAGGTVQYYSVTDGYSGFRFDKNEFTEISSSDIDNALALLDSGEASIASKTQPEKNAGKHIVFSMPGIIKADEEKEEK